MRFGKVAAFSGGRLAAMTIIIKFLPPRNEVNHGCSIYGSQIALTTISVTRTQQSDSQ
jgi:hypothetical protein